MKCKACGFEEGPKWVIKEIFYTSGKKKGQLKEKRNVETGSLQWIELYGIGGTDFCITTNDFYRNYKKKTINLFICPECNTVRSDKNIYV